MKNRAENRTEFPGCGKLKLLFVYGCLNMSALV